MPQVRRCKYKGCHALVELPAICCDKHKAYEAEYKANREYYSRSYYNKRVRNETEAKRERYSFYKSKMWTSLRKVCLDRDNYLCQYCLAVGIITPNAKTGDHVTPVEIAPELRTDPNNVVAACKRCDNVKRTLEQEIYGTGQGREIKNIKLRLSVADWSRLIFERKNKNENNFSFKNTPRPLGE
ncbi:HNH endonuclease [Streptococcus ferus]|uniref:HNH endonuclease n=1 Tax=Streptococcus ferus TaxID=1345 RepID=UPI003519BBFF